MPSGNGQDGRILVRELPLVRSTQLRSKSQPYLGRGRGLFYYSHPSLLGNPELAFADFSAFSFGLRGCPISRSLPSIIISVSSEDSLVPDKPTSQPHAAGKCRR